MIQLTFLLMFLFLLTSGCSKHIDFNPWTTLVRHIVESNIEKDK